MLPAAASCELCCFLAFAFVSGWDAAGEHKRITCFLWIGGLAPSDADPQRILTLQSFFGNLWTLLYCCGFAGSRDGLCFFSGIGGGSNMRLVPTALVWWGQRGHRGINSPSSPSTSPSCAPLAAADLWGSFGSVLKLLVGIQMELNWGSSSSSTPVCSSPSCCCWSCVCKSLGKRRSVARPSRKARQLMGGYGACAGAFHCLHLRFGGLMVEDCSLCARFGEQMGIDGRAGGGRSTIAVGTWL